MKDIKKLLEEKTKQLEEIGAKIQGAEKALGQLQAEALKLDGAINQLKELDEDKAEISEENK